MDGKCAGLQTRSKCNPLIPEGEYVGVKTFGWGVNCLSYDWSPCVANREIGFLCGRESTPNDFFIFFILGRLRATGYFGVKIFS
jgi:hypothetical protein